MAATYIITILLASLVQSILPIAAAADGLLHTKETDIVEGIDTKAADTVQALDTNGNGKVDKSEIAAFATSQGLSTEEVLADFQELDVNKDGELDSSEISGLLGDADAGQATPTHQDVVKATTSDKVSGLAASQKEATASVAAPALRTQNSKELRVAEQLSEAAQGGKVHTAVADARREPAKPASRMGLDLAVLEHDAQEQAGNVMASQLAQRAQELLARSSTDERKAKAFDAEVRTLRGNATTLTKQVNEETREAAKTTVSSVAKKSLAQLKTLQEQERQAEIAADAHRAQAAKAMKRVRKAQASLRVS